MPTAGPRQSVRDAGTRSSANTPPASGYQECQRSEQQEERGWFGHICGDLIDGGAGTKAGELETGDVDRIADDAGEYGGTIIIATGGAGDIKRAEQAVSGIECTDGTGEPPE